MWEVLLSRTYCAIGRCNVLLISTLDIYLTHIITHNTIVLIKNIHIFLIFSELEDCKPLIVPGRINSPEPLYYIELRMKDQVNTTLLAQEGKRPRVRCESEAIAVWVCL